MLLKCLCKMFIKTNQFTVHSAVKLAWKDESIYNKQTHSRCKNSLQTPFDLKLVGPSSRIFHSSNLVNIPNTNN